MQKRKELWWVYKLNEGNRDLNTKRQTKKIGKQQIKSYIETYLTNTRKNKWIENKDKVKNVKTKRKYTMKYTCTWNIQTYKYKSKKKNSQMEKRKYSKKIIK